MRQHNAATTPLPRFLVYWQHARHQLFAFTASVAAPTPQAARNIAGRQVPRNSRILGVKQSAGTGLRTLHQGRWVA
jgi:hypothetical protein